jgi:transposase InsO family protein
MPFSIQRFQTDRGKEFMAYELQEKMMEWGIKFCPIKPGSPHLNGKVERSQRTDLDEFYSSIAIKDPELETYLAEWEFYYNWHRPHSSLAGKTPNEKYSDMSNQTLSLKGFEEVSRVGNAKSFSLILTSSIV